MWLVTRERTLGFWDRRTAIEGGQRRREKEGKEERERERGARGRVRGWPVARVPARVRE